MRSIISRFQSGGGQSTFQEGGRTGIQSRDIITWHQKFKIFKTFIFSWETNKTPLTMFPPFSFLLYPFTLDPNGQFVEALGRQHTPEEAAKIINAHIGDWDGQPLKKAL